MNASDSASQLLLDTVLARYAGAALEQIPSEIKAHPLLQYDEAHPAQHFAVLIDLSQGSIIDVSGGIKGVLGIEAAELIGQPIGRMHERVFPPDQTQGVLLLQAAREQLGGDVLTLERPQLVMVQRFVHRSGDALWLQSHVHVLRYDATGRTGQLCLSLVTPAPPPVDGAVRLAVQVLDGSNARWVPIHANGAAAKLPDFTPRELAVIRMLSQGKTSREIAQLLETQTETINKLRKRLLELTQTRNSAELVHFALDRGLI